MTISGPRTWIHASAATASKRKVVRSTAMALHPNNQLLKVHLEGLPDFDGRFKNLKLVNWLPGAPAKRGAFSLVFSADDTIAGGPVAIKFYDVSPAAMTDAYRRQAFAREPEILQRLLTRSRCLQLVKGLGSYPLPVPGSAFMMGCEYFVIEWLEDQIDEYFLDPKATRFDALSKMRMFNDILLAVAALHRRDVFHRDLKIDNLRSREQGARRLVIAIDLGTAARLDSPNILPAYGGPVGAIGYSSSEARCGLAGNRALAPYSDIYAVGCLLFQLFNPDLFYARLDSLNPGIDIRLAAMATVIPPGVSPNIQIEKWHEALTLFGSGVTPVNIDGPGANIPAAIVPNLNELLAKLTHFDYRNRPRDLEQVAHGIQSTIRLLSNEQAYQRRLREVRARRLAKLQAIARRDAKFKAQMLRKLP